MGKRPIAAALALSAGLGLGVALTYLAVRKREEPEEDMGTQGGSFRVVDEGVTVDVESKPKS